MSYELRQFVANTSGGLNTVSLRLAGSRDQTFYQDFGDEALSGVVQLWNGQKYNANGTWPADVRLGQARAIYLCRGANQQAANQQAAVLTAINGRSGTLYGIEYTASGVATHTCSAIASSRVTAMIDKIGASTGKAHSVEVEMVFDRLSRWS